MKQGPRRIDYSLIALGCRLTIGFDLFGFRPLFSDMFFPISSVGVKLKRDSGEYSSENVVSDSCDHGCQSFIFKIELFCE